jgi:hypothetical protein
MKQLNTRSHICGGMMSTIIFAGALQTLPPLKPFATGFGGEVLQQKRRPCAGALGFLTFVQAFEVGP